MNLILNSSFTHVLLGALLQIARNYIFPMFIEEVWLIISINETKVEVPWKRYFDQF